MSDNALWTLLRQAQVDQFRFKRQAPIGRYVADFVCPAARLVVEMETTPQGAARDPAREAWFVQQGFRVLRVRGSDVQRDARGVLQRVQAALLDAAPRGTAVAASAEAASAAVAPVVARHAVAAPAPVEPASVEPEVVEPPVVDVASSEVAIASVIADPAQLVPEESVVIEPVAVRDAAPPIATTATKFAPAPVPASKPAPAADSPWAKAKAAMAAAQAAPSAATPAATPAAATEDDSPWARARRERERRASESQDAARVADAPAAASPATPQRVEPVAPQRVEPPRAPVRDAAPVQAITPGRPREPVAPPTARRTDTVEARLHGLNACLAAFAARPDDLRKVYLLQSRLHALRDVLAWCVSHRLGYRVVEDADLTKLAGSTHHEGVVFDLLVRRQPTLDALLASLPATPQRLLWLDGVGNPHNFGAVLRTAAHFGAAAVLLPPDSTLTLSGAAARVAEGGAEALAVVRLDDSAAAVAALRAAGFELAATLPRDAASLYAGDLPPRCVFVLGAERHGMQHDLVAQCDLRVNIPGTGKVESLNIANAVGVLLAEHWRQHA